MTTKIHAVQQLQALAQLDSVGAEPMTLYSGVADAQLRAQLTGQLRSAIDRFIVAVEGSATQAQYLAILSTELHQFDRDALETEDAERVAGNFESIMDAVGLESSGGALNDWMYGFDPGQS